MNTQNNSRLALCAVAIICSMSLGGCAENTLVEPFQEITIQLPVIVSTRSNAFGAVPKVNLDYASLSDYQVYRDNQDKITGIDLYQMSFMFRDLAAQVSQTNPTPLLVDNMQVTSINFSIQVAGDTREYDVASFANPRIRDYMLIPHPMDVPRETSAAIAEALKKQSQIKLISRYGTLTQGSVYFTRINAQIELVFRLTVKPF